MRNIEHSFLICTLIWRPETIAAVNIVKLFFNLCMLGILHALFSSAVFFLFFFFKLNIFKIHSEKVSDSLQSRSGTTLCQAWSGSKLQRLSIDNTSRVRGVSILLISYSSTKTHILGLLIGSGFHLTPSWVKVQNFKILNF